MHSKIFQISRKPISKDNYITEDRYYDGFVGEIADYVDIDSSYHDICIDYLGEYLGDAAKINGNKIKIIDKRKYFDKKYEEFIQYAKKIVENTSPEEFAGDYSGDLGFNIINLTWSYEDKYGFYVDDNDEDAGLEPIDTFLRRAKNGDVFYFGEVIDYHF